MIELVKKYGPKRWTLIAKHLKGRIGKQCRERWHNHLNPEIKKTAWTEDEVSKLLLEYFYQSLNQFSLYNLPLLVPLIRITNFRDIYLQRKKTCCFLI